MNETLPFPYACCVKRLTTMCGAFRMAPNGTGIAHYLPYREKSSRGVVANGIEGDFEGVHDAKRPGLFTN